MSTTLPLLHLDDDFAAVLKPAGLLVHRSALDDAEQDTLMDRLRRDYSALAAAQWAPGHRLDKGTSGVLICARHKQAAQYLGHCFAEGRAQKWYLALVRGWPEQSIIHDRPLARDPELPSQGQILLEACTHFSRIARTEWPFQVQSPHPSSRYALVIAQPQQGRRHQIRRHLKQLSHPIIGDSTHGKGAHNRAVADYLGVNRLWLHALRLRLPLADDRWLDIQAPLDSAWSKLFAQGPWQHDNTVPSWWYSR